MKLSVVELTKKLISIPSFVDKKCDESKLGEFLLDLNQQTSNLPIQKMYLDGSKTRFNLYYGNPNPKILIIGHLDTVRPQSPIAVSPYIKDNRLYGLGSADMKGSIAAFLTALSQNSSNPNLSQLGILWYCDEEYDFAGMKSYLTQYSKTSKPNLILSLDGNLQVASGCRGLVEIQAKVSGVSGHSSKPFLGKNALLKTFQIVDQIDQQIRSYSVSKLGVSSTNLAMLNGGSDQGNIIAKDAKFIFEVRTSSPQLTGKFIASLMEQAAKKLEVQLQIINIRQNLKPWMPSKNSAINNLVKQTLKIEGLNSNIQTKPYSGYIDIAMLEEIYPNIPKLILGAGGDNAHSPAEFIPIENLFVATKVYSRLLKVLLAYSSS